MSFDSNRLSHAYITDDAFASTIAMAVVCSARGTPRPCRSCIHCDKAARNIHPDITVVGKLEDKLIVSVDQIRELKKDVYIVPNEAEQKAYIVNDADAMNLNAQNAFLQILEEPPAHAVFILCTNNPDALLPTVCSRCVELKPGAEKPDSIPGYESSADPGDPISSSVDASELEELVTDFISALDNDSLKLMECMFRLDKLDRSSFSGFLTLARESVIASLRESITSGSTQVCKTLADADSVLLKAREMQDLNVSAGHISGFICASLVE